MLDIKYIRDNKEIATIAVKQNKEAYHYLSSRLKNDEDMKILLQ